MIDGRLRLGWRGLARRSRAQPTVAAECGVECAASRCVAAVVEGAHGLRFAETMPPEHAAHEWPAIRSYHGTGAEE